MKTCTKCGETMAAEAFHLAKGTRDGRRGECKACAKAIKAAWYLRNRERAIERATTWQSENRERYNAYLREYKRARPGLERDGHLRRKFGINQVDYLAMLEAQGGGCAICERPPSKKRSLHVDHDHATGEVRGLLCFTCNNGLGQFREDPAVFEAAVTYLQTGDSVAATRELGAGARERACALVGASTGTGQADTGDV